MCQSEAAPERMCKPSSSGLPSGILKMEGEGNLPQLRKNAIDQRRLAYIAKARMVARMARKDVEWMALMQY